MEITFESDYRSKVLHITFAVSSTLGTKADVQAWRSAWTQALSSWHSPYKVLVDCSNLMVLDPMDPEVEKAMQTMLLFFKGLFLRKIVGFGFQGERGHLLLPFDVFPTYEEAAEQVGIRERKVPQAEDFRATLQFDNHFEQQVIELHFTQDVTIDTEEKLRILKDKLLNNLSQWHSGYHLLIDCSKLTVAADLAASFARLETFFRGFFLKSVLGYAPKHAKENYPFPTFRSRHKAAAELKIAGEELVSGRTGNCATRKTST